MPHPIRTAIQEGRLCRNLRTKAMFVFGDDGAVSAGGGSTSFPPPAPQDVAGESAPPSSLVHIPDTAAFWCNCSGYALGPDRIPVNAERCADRARTCFEGEVSA